MSNIIRAVLLALALLASGCGSADRHSATPPAHTRTVTSGESSSTDESSSPSGFRRFASTGDVWEIERFESLKQLVTRSDLVFVGTVTDGHWGREYRDVEVDASGTDVMVARDLIFTLHVDDIIGGRSESLQPGTVEVVIDLIDPPFRLDPPVGEQAVFFLRRIGAPVPGHDLPADPKLLAQDLYRPVSSIGVLDLDRGHLAFPLGGGADWAIDLLGLSWDEAIAQLRSLA